MSKDERGDRQVNRIDVLVELARQLRVTLNDLMGEPVLFEDEDSSDDVPAVHDALMSPQRLSQTLFGGRMQPEYVGPEPVARVAKEIWHQYQNGSVGHVIGVLPGVVPWDRPASLNVVGARLPARLSVPQNVVRQRLPQRT